MTKDSYIKQEFKEIKLWEKRLNKIKKLIKEIEERPKTPQFVLKMCNPRVIELDKQTKENFKIQIQRYKNEKEVYNYTRDKLLHKMNLTG